MTDVVFDRIGAKVLAGERLAPEEGLFLFRDEVDLHAVGALADAVRRRHNQAVAYYNVNAHINPTNICVYRCPLCAYSCDPGDPRGYVLGADAIARRAREAVEAGCTEIHVVGGVHPELSYAWSLDLIARLRQTAPGIHLKAWTAVEIDRFARISGQSARDVLRQMIDAGLGSLPGGGAEIFAPAVRRRIAPKKADADTWLAVHREAHALGLRTNASMLFGHVETPADRIDHLVRLRTLQDETGGFQAFIPLAFHPENTALAACRRVSALVDLRTVAVCRLMLDNIPHIKAYWVSLGVGTAQVALSYGADDLDGTVRHEEIHHQAGATSPDALSVPQLRHLISEAGFQPVERDSLYRPIA